MILVDGLHSEERGEPLRARRSGSLPVPSRAAPSRRRTTGPTALTGSEYFAPASARNTGIVHAEPSLRRLRRRRLAADGARVAGRGRDAAQRRLRRRRRLRRSIARWPSRTAGSQPARRPEGLDSRWIARQRRRDSSQVGGGALYGCSFGMPQQPLLDAQRARRALRLDHGRGQPARLSPRARRGSRSTMTAACSRSRATSSHDQGQRPGRLDEPAPSGRLHGAPSRVRRPRRDSAAGAGTRRTCSSTSSTGRGRPRASATLPALAS